MKKLTQFILGFSSLLFAVSSCSKETLGPDIVGLYSPATIIDSLKKSQPNVDFSKDETVYFTAKFEKTTDWLLTLKGNTSGAVKTFTGVSSSLDVSNARWTGYANTVPSFQKENITATLTFKHTTDTLKTTITTTGLRNLDKDGVLVTNFSSFKFVHSWANDPVNQNCDWAYADKLYNGFPKADGGAYCTMMGHPWKNDFNNDKIHPVTNPYVNYLDIKASKADFNYVDYFPLPADSNRVYFSLMVYGTGTPNTRLLVNFMEENIDARYADIKITWTGWKLLTFQYAELLDKITTKNQPDKVNQVSFILLNSKTGPFEATGSFIDPVANPPLDDQNPNFVSVAFDHPTFTINHPYQP